MKDETIAMCVSMKLAMELRTSDFKLPQQGAGISLTSIHTSACNGFLQCFSEIFSQRRVISCYIIAT